MTRDYKYATSKTKQPLPGWLWLITGFALGLIVAFFVYLNGQQALKEARQNALGKAHADLSERQAEQRPEESAESAKRKFDFYTLLPELEVVVPEEDQPQRGSQPVPQAPSHRPEQTGPPASQASSGYVLQAGSFQKLIEADSLKARLALMGMESSIQTVRVNGDTWHRVRVGPYQDRQQANRVRAKLRKNHIDTVLLVTK
jgi:cell division protein FtsN